MSAGGITITTPIERLTRVGSPQPSFAIGPNRNVPSCGGKIARRSLMIRGAFATMSCGNMMLSIASLRIPCISASKSIVRLSPRRPPTAFNVKPKPSWMPGPKSAVRMISSEKPGVPSGFFVLMSPIAETPMNPAIWNWRIPTYSPRAESIERKPPPVMIARSSESPAPVGGLNATSSCAGPRLPPPGGNDAVINAPIRSTLAESGPSSAERAAESSTGIVPLLKLTTR